MRICHPKRISETLVRSIRFWVSEGKGIQIETPCSKLSDQESKLH